MSPNPIIAAAINISSQEILHIRSKFKDKLLTTIPVPDRLTYFIENGEVKDLHHVAGTGCCLFCDNKKNDKG